MTAPEGGFTGGEAADLAWRGDFCFLLPPAVLLAEAFVGLAGCGCGGVGEWATVGGDDTGVPFRSAEAKNSGVKRNPP